MPPTDLIANATWQLEVCNACRYCEGYCAVFPAVERRRSFTEADVHYLANLCHDCRPCYYACMYAPPHEFAVNIPQVFSEVRRRTYDRYAVPRVLADLAASGWRFAALVAGLALLFFVAVAALAGGGAGFFATHEGPGAFYAVIPYAALFLPTLAVALFGAAALAIGGLRYWRETWGSPRDLLNARALAGAGVDALAGRLLQGGENDGCSYPAEPASRWRWVLHLLVLWGFIAALVATAVAFLYQDLLGILPPYPLLSLPVALGTLGGVAMIVGASGLIYLKWRSDPAPADREHVRRDYLFLVLFDVVSLTGMLLLLLRGTAAMNVLLIVHVATVFALFLTAPYGKFAHFLYRYAALVQNRLETGRQN